MARIKNTEPERYRLRELYREDILGEHYDPPGICFSEQDGTVARVREECVDALLAEYDFLERVDDTGTDDSDSTPDTDDAAATTDTDDEDADAEADTIVAEMEDAAGSGESSDTDT